MYLKLFLFFIFAIVQTKEEVVSTSQSPLEEVNPPLLTNTECNLNEQPKKIEPIKNLKKSVPENCLELKKRGFNQSGVYVIQPKFAPQSFMVKCNMETRLGGWTQILNRMDGSLDFLREWKPYKKGFGNLAGEFWLGLENIYHLTGFADNELLVEIVDPKNQNYFAHYNLFAIGNESDGYYLKVLEDYAGTAGDGLKLHVGQKFSTIDRDQDTWKNNCAKEFVGAWWYKECHQSQLTGKYNGVTVKGARWLEVFNLKEARMFVRPQYSVI